MRNLYLIASLLLLSFCSFGQTQILFYTTMGEFTVELNEQYAPITAGNFKTLVEQKYYDGVLFHRVIDNFMIQGGIGSFVPAIIADEFHDSLSNIITTISMANAGPNTATSQFFINLKDNSYLDSMNLPSPPQHAVFGKVIANFSVVQAIGKVVTDGSDKPLADVVMDSLRVIPGTFIAYQDKMIQKFIYYPNPFTNSITIELQASPKNPLSFTLYNFLGKVVKQAKNIRSRSIQLERDNLPNGLYYFNVFSEEGRIGGRKLIIQ